MEKYDKQLYKPNVFNTFRGQISSKFKLGDVVRITQFGQRYDTYKNAFEFFKILDKAQKRNFFYHLNYDYDLHTNYIICGIGIHSQLQERIVYCLVNRKKQYIIMDEKGITNRYIHGKELDVLVNKNKNYFIDRIP